MNSTPHFHTCDAKAIFTVRALLHVYHKWHFESISLSEMSVNAQLQLTARERVENVTGFIYNGPFGDTQPCFRVPVRIYYF